jgi:FAD synthetase
MKKNLVMVFGTFDHLHAGHENLFKQARKHGEEVVAVIARDDTVKHIKGFYPDNKQKTRKQNLEDTKWANKVIIGHSKDKTQVIKDLRPNVIALGYDQFAFTQNLEKLLIDIKLDAEVVRLKSYKPNMYKSSIIRNERKEKEKSN